MIAFARPLEQEIAPGISIHLCEVADLPPEVQAALPELLNQLEKHYDALDQQRAIAEHQRLQQQRGDQDWWLIVDLVLVSVVLFLVNRWAWGI